MYDKIRKETIEELKAFYTTRTPVLPAMHTKLLELFREYVVVGGMPRVVQNFVDNHNFASVLKIQRDILDDYRKDIAKYAEGIEKAKVRDCFQSIPNQLAKNYKKFQWNVIEKQGSSRKYRDSIMWLIDAGMVEKCDNLAIPELPLAGNVKDGDLGIYKGALYENIVADIFRKSGKQLFHFAKDNRFEIDFVVRAVM